MLSSQFLILGGRDSTRALQSSPIQKYENLKKSQKFTFFDFFFFLKIFFRRRKKNTILLVFQYQDDAIRPELFSPPRFRIQGGYPECDGQRTKKEGRRRRKSLCLILDLYVVQAGKSAPSLQFAGSWSAGHKCTHSLQVKYLTPADHRLREKS